MGITIAQAVRALMIREPFYGLFLMGLNKYFNNTVDTACVSRNGINLEIIINEDYGNSLDSETARKVIQHETLHIIFKHPEMWGDYTDKTRFGIACDLQVNGYIDGIPDTGYHPKDFEFEIGKGVKWYYEHLPKNLEPDSLKNSKHDGNGFSSLTSAERKLLENQTDYLAKSTAEEILKTHGNIPGYLKEYIDFLLEKKVGVFNGKAYFRRVIGNSIKTYIKSSRYRPSKRFKNQPGSILKFKPKVLVAVDTSGSVSNTELQDFFSEIHHLYLSGIAVDIVEFDTCIQNKFVYKGQKTDIKIVGRGGTDMSDVYTLYVEHPEYSTLVVFTDGYLNINYPKRKNMVGVISSNGQHQDYPGISIYVPKEN